MNENIKIYTQLAKYARISNAISGEIVFHNGWMGYFDASQVSLEKDGIVMFKLPIWAASEIKSD